MNNFLFYATNEGFRQVDTEGLVLEPFSSLKFCSNITEHGFCFCFPPL